MGNVQAIPLDAINIQMDRDGNIVGSIDLNKINEQLIKIKHSKTEDGSVRFFSELRREFKAGYSHMPPVVIQWGTPKTTPDNSSDHSTEVLNTPTSNGIPVKQSAADEEL